MKKLLNKKSKGYIDVMLAFIISLIFFFMIFVYTIEYTQPIVKYITLNQKVRKYILIMEKDGGLSPLNLNNLKTELISSGFNEPDLTINATMAPVDFGGEITLEVEYKFKKIEKTINGLLVTSNEKIMPMKVKKSSTSKKVLE
ncbi:MAG: hypothetical protein N2448_06480 [Caloramator sp.]|nr:hypothetical protein [Caloramator sp.]